MNNIISKNLLRGELPVSKWCRRRKDDRLRKEKKEREERI